MLREIMIIVALNFGYILMNIPTVDARFNHMGRKYLKNVEKSIVINCNQRALAVTNNIDAFECVNNKFKNCCDITNITDFMKIRNECFSEYRVELGKGVFISILIWTILIILCSIKPN